MGVSFEPRWFRGLSVYQDVLLDGEKVLSGARDCPQRWEAIEPHLPAAGSILDVGSNFGWFGLKICQSRPESVVASVEADRRSAWVQRRVLPVAPCRADLPVDRSSRRAAGRAVPPGGPTLRRRALPLRAALDRGSPAVLIPPGDDRRAAVDRTARPAGRRRRRRADPRGDWRGGRLSFVVVCGPDSDLRSPVAEPSRPSIHAGSLAGGRAAGLAGRGVARFGRGRDARSGAELAAAELVARAAPASLAVRFAGAIAPHVARPRLGRPAGRRQAGKTAGQAAPRSRESPVHCGKMVFPPPPPPRRPDSPRQAGLELSHRRGASGGHPEVDAEATVLWEAEDAARPGFRTLDNRPAACDTTALQFHTRQGESSWPGRTE